MSVRVTNSMMSRQLLTNLNSISKKLYSLENDLSTTVKIHRPSDDPVGAAKTMYLKSSLEKNGQYQRNVDYAVSWTDAAEVAFSSLDEIMQRARELSVKASTGTLAADERQAIADEIQQIYSQIVDLGNADVSGRYIFAGTETDKPPFINKTATDPATGKTELKYEYNENDQLISMQFGDGIYMPINITGGEPFKNCLNNLSQIHKALQDDNQDLLVKEAISRMEESLGEVINIRAENGAITKRMEMVKSRLEDLELNYDTLLSNVYDTVLSDTIMDLTTAETIQRAAMSIGSQIIQPSLIDFLK